MKRRKFIKNTAALVATAAVAPVALASSEKSKPDGVCNLISERFFMQEGFFDSEKTGWISSAWCRNGDPLKGDILMFQTYTSKNEYVFRHGYVSASKIVQVNGRRHKSVYVTMLDGKIYDVAYAQYVIRGNAMAPCVPADAYSWEMTDEDRLVLRDGGWKEENL